MTAAIATPINHIKLAPGSAMIISGLTWNLIVLGSIRYLHFYELAAQSKETSY